MKITRTFDLLERYAALPDKDDALCHKQSGQWKKYSSREYCELTRNLSYGLYELGLRKGDMLITISSNRPEWNFADLAMAMLGIIHVPVFPSLTTAEYEYIIRNCNAKAVFVSDEKLLKIVRPAALAADSSIHIFTFDRIEGSRQQVVRRNPEYRTLHWQKYTARRLCRSHIYLRYHGQTQRGDAFAPQPGKQLPGCR